ncbi:MAG: orotidine-5'-phosphate decarboxylase [Gammaproteobacteria bacterium]|jgi:orotidine-5'-phosphate decarboxylase|uniref:orotidine-5'-phosphate decarboxylase n=1 Tax=Marinomonas polaris TaxID=293552 RepID=UPI001E1AD514|nr:orotidine-5'-phosphate decarboxylase [Gammaproteobacteria bacterium]MBU1467663.1 orotidine-5'-phosphate decarboxylase [Gammaproteobacteria bacterium]MBU2023314.1 orotidine-5'-phosphate decarboxylase [Gammaproteobacteria bacterium]MBU2238239.1 orotidine-5'-phosphate decarboxylase [Gammaproteobacteria bacterium]MBU2318611.1 orotidine-5'-phosphate decarboxylase [Gammaproteobacteria bacterium]
MSCQSPIVVALDYPTMAQSIEMAKRLDPEQCRVKVGKELFTTAGPVILDELHKLGFEIFLDLKFHDIPNTVANAVSVAARAGVWMVNVHASGGRRMMEASANALQQLPDNKTLLIAVTVLTSMDQSDLIEIGIDATPEQHVKRLAALAKSSGMDGVVCSAQESSMLSADLGKDFVLVTPGIRPTGSDQGDQKRIMTPAEAMAAGSHYLVMGRPITQANDPIAVLTQANADLGLMA